MDYKSSLFGFEGRINRARYWLGTLMILAAMFFSLLMLAVICIRHDISTGPLSINLVGISASIKFKLTHDDASAALFPRVAVLAMRLVFGWCYAAISIKRLHDRNKSGWWIVPYLVAPGVCSQFDEWLGDSWPAVFISYATGIAFLWGLIELNCLKGTRGPNRFGPNPLARRDTRSPWDQHSELGLVPHSAGPSAGA